MKPVKADDLNIMRISISGYVLTEAYLDRYADTDKSVFGKGNWTDERVAQLKEWWPNFSASEIAKKLGGVTRCGVIGKARRLGLQKPEYLFSEHPRAVRARRERKGLRFERQPRPPRRPCARNGAAASDLPSPVPPLLPSLDIPLIETDRRQCKFIHGDKDLCCGHPVKPESSYCPAHHALCWLPPPKRERKKISEGFKLDHINGAWV